MDRRSHHLEMTAMLLVAVCVAAIIWSPALLNLQNSPRNPRSQGFQRDWEITRHNLETSIVALTRHGELGLWNPYHCGGVTAAGNPESLQFSLALPLALLVGSNPALKLYLFLHAIAGLLGFFLLARREFAMALPAALLGGVAWVGSGFFAVHANGGHVTFAPFYLLPLVLLAWRRAVDTPRWCAALIAVAALIVFEAGTYALPYAMLLLGFDAIVLCLDRSRRRGVVRTVLLSAPLLILLTSVRTLPIIETLSQFRQSAQSTDKLTLSELLPMFTARQHADFWGHRWVWGEYATYMGWGILALTLPGLLWAWRERQRQLLIGLGLFVLLMMGNHAEWWPWPLLRKLPLYGALRVPSRFRVVVSLFLALLAGGGLTWIATLLSRIDRSKLLRLGALALPWLLAGTLCVDVIWSNRRSYDVYTLRQPARMRPLPQRQLLPLRGYAARIALLPAMNLGTTSCRRWAIPWRVSPRLRLGNVPQVWLAASHGRVEWVKAGVSSVNVALTLEKPDRLVINQNHARGWHSEIGRVVSEKGLLAVALPAGTHRVALWFRPTSLVVGGALSVVGLILTLLLAICGLPPWRRRRSQRPIDDDVTIRRSP